MNSSIYIFGFYDLLCFTLDFYILGPLKCLMIPRSIKRIETTNSLFLWVPFLILFLHVFVKYKCDLRLKYVLASLVFLSSIFFLSTNGSSVYNNFKIRNRLQFYSPDYIGSWNKLHKTRLLSQFSILIISKFKAINNNKYFYLLI